MINPKVFELVIKILDSRLPPQTQEEVVRFYLLPRNTPIRPLIELPDEEVLNQLGTVKRPTQEDIDKKNDPDKEEKEAVAKTLKGMGE